MRSYKDCLIEYLEERTYTELNLSWYNYLKSSIATTSQTNFQIIENLPPVEQEVDFSFYADVLPSNNLVTQFQLFSLEKMGSVYKTLINKLIETEYIHAKNSLNISGLNWKSCRQVLEYSVKQPNRKFTDVLIAGLGDSGVDERQINNYLLKEYGSTSISYLDVIEDFFEIDNYHLDIPKYTLIPLVDEIDSIRLDYDSRLLNATPEIQHWTSRVNPVTSHFFHGDDTVLEELNRKAKISGVTVQGELSGYQAYEVETGSWWNEEIIKQLFDDNSKLSKRIDYKDKSELEQKLSRKVSAFHCIKEFDITITVFNHFEESDANLLKSISFSVFPFHFSRKSDHYKWISVNEDNNLVIRLKSKTPKTNIIGTALKIYKS